MPFCFYRYISRRAFFVIIPRALPVEVQLFAKAWGAIDLF
jgi:hypothetical protein